MKNPFPQSYPERFKVCTKELADGKVRRCWCAQHHDSEVRHLVSKAKRRKR